MKELWERMTEIENPRHPSYEKYSLLDILMIVMCVVLSGLDTLGDLVYICMRRFIYKEHVRDLYSQIAARSMTLSI